MATAEGVMKWPRPKQISKRRWLARFELGKFIPHTALMEHKSLLKRIRKSAVYEPCLDGIRMARLFETPNMGLE